MLSSFSSSGFLVLYQLTKLLLGDYTHIYTSNFLWRLYVIQDHPIAREQLYQIMSPNLLRIILACRLSNLRSCVREKPKEMQAVERSWIPNSMSRYPNSALKSFLSMVSMIIKHNLLE